MTEQRQSTTYPALSYVMREYLSYGEAGVEDLRNQVNRRNRSPQIEAFCVELHQILIAALPTPTEVINESMEERETAYNSARPVDEPAVQLPRYDEQGAYEACAELWDALGLEVDAGESDIVASAAPATAAARRRPTSIVFSADAGEALATWWSWRLFAGFSLGVVLGFGSWKVANLIPVAWLAIPFWGLAIIGIFGGMISGFALWQRRVRFANPDAYLPRDRAPEPTRKQL
ncbi:hypothetical protein GS504_01845 [Rhodococcus hoagii]|nr:hypothetical protein [Prescottella equi]NKS72233.1 hypothetical protein [Prescottella equi]